MYMYKTLIQGKNFYPLLSGDTKIECCVCKISSEVAAIRRDYNMTRMVDHYKQQQQNKLKYKGMKITYLILLNN